MNSKRNKVTQNTANMEKRDSDETTSILNAIEQMKNYKILLEEYKKYKGQLLIGKFEFSK